MIGQEHDRGFMVAGAMKADLLTDLAAAVDKAIAEGRGIEEFRKDFRAIVAKNGWTGWTGEGSVRGEAWRVRTILRTNSYTSYSAGASPAPAGNFAFWVYRHGGSREPRLEHLALDGLRACAGPTAFWTKFYPPSELGLPFLLCDRCAQRGRRFAASAEIRPSRCRLDGTRISPEDRRACRDRRRLGLCAGRFGFRNRAGAGRESAKLGLRDRESVHGGIAARTRRCAERCLSRTPFNRR